MGHWQVTGLALYSYGVVAARQCAPSKVAEYLGGAGKISCVQRRLERWLSNGRIDWQACCRAWSAFVLRRYVGERIILLVDETKLGSCLSAMVVGLWPIGAAAFRWWVHRCPEHVSQARRSVDLARHGLQKHTLSRPQFV